MNDGTVGTTPSDSGEGDVEEARLIGATRTKLLGNVEVDLLLCAVQNEMKPRNLLDFESHELTSRKSHKSI